MALTFSGILEKVTTRADRSYAITIGTQELSPEKGAALLGLFQIFANFAISQNNISTEELEQDSNLDVSFIKQGKSPCQRLRNTLFILWKQNNEDFENFNSYYLSKMEGILNIMKSKIQ